MQRRQLFFPVILFTFLSFTIYGENLASYSQINNESILVAQNDVTKDKKDVPSSQSSDLLADAPYYIETFEVQKKETIHINAFYFVNHFFLHVFSNFGLLEKLKTEDIEYIVEEILKGLSSREPVNFVFNNYKNGKKLAISLSIVSKEKSNYLLILTNYDSKQKDVLPLDTPKNKRMDCFSSIYYIAANKLVNENHFYSKEIEGELKKSGMLTNLADFYIFDEKTDNDSLIEEMLTKAYSSAKTPEDKYQAAILFSLYYLMIDKADLALTALDNAKTLLDKEIKVNKKLLAQALDIQFLEFKLIEQLKEKGY